MELEFRCRDYRTEDEFHSLPRVPAELHPLTTSSSSLPQVDLVFKEESEIIDPLRAIGGEKEVSIEAFQDKEINLTAASFVEAAAQDSSKEWISFKKFLMQRFPVPKMISVSSVSAAIMKSIKVNSNSSVDVHLEELDDHIKISEEGFKVISQQEYVSRLHELKDEITHAWHNDDRVTALKLSIKVARLLMDTSVKQFYPTLFILATDVMDLLGDLVWERIKQKAEYAEDGTFICSLPDNFGSTSICDDAKETCNNWFCKIGSIRELLPRIYLELAIFPCWRFLADHPAKCLERVVKMTRGIADPLALAYCHLYMVHCAQKLPHHNVVCTVSGYNIAGINDLKNLIMRATFPQQTRDDVSSGDERLLLSLMEPTIEYVMKIVFKDLNEQTQVRDILVGLGLGKDQSDLFGERPCPSVIIHHLLKELPIGVICSSAMNILHLIGCSADCSFDQFLNYKLLGLRLCESVSQVSEAIAVVNKVIQVTSLYHRLDEYMKVLDAYVDIVLQNQLQDTHLNMILEKIFELVCNEGIDESALASLQSFFTKLLTHFDNLNDILSLNHFIDILDLMHGTTRNMINIQILRIATRNNCLQDPTIIHFLFEVSQALHDGVDFLNIKADEHQHSAQLISRFVNIAEFGQDFERNLSFLVDCRGAFGSMSQLKETLVHSSNRLAVKAMQYGSNHASFVKSCLTFSEVTIPSIPAHTRQWNLYIETAEVAFLGGLVSHADGLIDSVIWCFQNFDLADGTLTSSDHDAYLSSVCKLCSLVILVPGNFEQGFMNVPRSVFGLVNSQSRMTAKLQIRGLCALISALAALSQNSNQSHMLPGQVLSNSNVFFGDMTYLQELLSLSGVIVQKIIDIVSEEPLQTTRGYIALEACNCIASSFKGSEKTWAICSTLVEIAKSSLGSDNIYLKSTRNFLDSTSLYLK
ncbi:hypothetical protein M9H77_15143 [Catharanthus roseus]|uniref:Uncharacterized protein n=1 Tax=Catharanthus roseus TaxID=4058 RepID=A0ACC0BQ19_CATRO|nr:hypothetical protein M9H77_15143 [Catharanthus roseus]